MNETASYGPLNHPQRLEGEVYMGRCWEGWSPERDRERGWPYGWETKRQGTAEPWQPERESSASERRNPLAGSLPWFVQAAELAEAGVWDTERESFVGEWDDPGWYAVREAGH